MSPPATILGKNSPRIISDALLQTTHFEKLEMINFDSQNNKKTHQLLSQSQNQNQNQNQNSSANSHNDADNTENLNGNDNAEELENTPQYPTEEEIEAIQQEAWNSGHEVGFSTGYTEGLEKGLTEGFEQGKTEGLVEGKSEGLEIGKAEGLEIGQREGFDAGEKAGREKGEKEISEIVNQMKLLLTSMQEAMKHLESGIGDELLHLALKIAKQVIRARINSGGDYLHFLVQDALRILPTEHGTLNIRLNPDDLMNFRVYLEDNPSHINIVTDKEISRGGCHINVGNTHIDATIETRWKRSISPLGVENDWHDPAPLNAKQDAIANDITEDDSEPETQNIENTQNTQETQNSPREN